MEHELLRPEDVPTLCAGFAYLTDYHGGQWTDSYRLLSEFQRELRALAIEPDAALIVGRSHGTYVTLERLYLNAEDATRSRHMPRIRARDEGAQAFT